MATFGGDTKNGVAFKLDLYKNTGDVSTKTLGIVDCITSTCSANMDASSSQVDLTSVSVMLLKYYIIPQWNYTADKAGTFDLVVTYKNGFFTFQLNDQPETVSRTVDMTTLKDGFWISIGTFYRGQFRKAIINSAFYCKKYSLDLSNSVCFPNKYEGTFLTEFQPTVSFSCSLYNKARVPYTVDQIGEVFVSGLIKIVTRNDEKKYQSLTMSVNPLMVSILQSQ